jgi:hypothetical protein
LEDNLYAYEVIQREDAIAIDPAIARSTSYSNLLETRFSKKPLA